MSKETEFENQSKLVRQMADMLEVDLGEAVLSGKLNNFPYQDIVHRCSRCLEQDACQKWMDTNAPGQAETPSYCRNKRILENLRDQQQSQN